MAILVSFSFGGRLDRHAPTAERGAARCRGHAASSFMQDQAQMSLKIRVRTAATPPRSPYCARIPDPPHLLHFFHWLSRAGGERLVVAAARRIREIRTHTTRPIYDGADQTRGEENRLVQPSQEGAAGCFRRGENRDLPQAASAPENRPVAIIATAPKPKSVKQFIWQPVPKVEIHQDLPAPNLIARAAMAIPAPAPASRAQTEGRQTGHARREISAT